VSDVTAVVAELRQEIPDLLAEHKVPGLSIGLCDASDVLWSAGFGTTRRGGDQPIRTSTMFSVQSTSKMYTATAVMLAVQSGLVDLDEPITTYLPEFTVRSRFESAPERRMTLRHLLSHTAGFTHEAPVGSNFGVGKGTFEAHCRSISDTWLRFPVGHHYEYSNLGIDLAGYTLQRVTGRPFHEYVRQNLLAPLGLLRTTFDHRAIGADDDRAIGHSAMMKRLPVRVPMVAAGGLYTTVDDALRYVQFHLRAGDRLLDPALLDQMYQIPFASPGQQHGYGLGVTLARWDDRTVYNHGGAGFGFQSDLAWVPHAGSRGGLGVVVLTNAVGHPLAAAGQDAIAARLVRECLGPTVNAVDELPPAASLPRHVLARFAGEYVGRGWTSMTVLSDGSELWQQVGDERRPLRVTARDEFVAEFSRQRFRLVEDGDRAYLLCLDDGFTRYRNDPVSRRPPTGPAIDPRWAGDYVVKASGVTLQSATLQCRDGATFLRTNDAGLRLDYHEPGIYYLCDGEVLDLTRTPATLANIPLHRHVGVGTRRRGTPEQTHG
jgi:CubicO group peptidase (beta-lactamase class C family)